MIHFLRENNIIVNNKCFLFAKFFFLLQLDRRARSPRWNRNLKIIKIVSCKIIFAKAIVLPFLQLRLKIMKALNTHATHTLLYQSCRFEVALNTFLKRLDWEIARKTIKIYEKYEKVAKIHPKPQVISRKVLWYVRVLLVCVWLYVHLIIMQSRLWSKTTKSNKIKINSEWIISEKIFEIPRDCKIWNNPSNIS